MADEPNSKMDELLKAYARKRRADGGNMPEMHPATRRMLQAEVARAHKKKPVQSARHWLGLLPRVGFAFSIAIVLAIVVWSLRPPRTEVQVLSKSETPAPTAVRDREASEADRFSGRNDRLNDGRGKLVEDEIMREQQKADPRRADELRSDAPARRLAETEVKLKQMAEKRASTPPPAAPPVVLSESLNRPQVAQEPQPEARSLLLADKDTLQKKSEITARAGAEVAPPSATTAGVAGGRAFAQNGTVASSDFAKTLNAGQATSNKSGVYSLNSVGGTPAVPGGAGASSNVFLGIAPLSLAGARQDDANVPALGAVLAFNASNVQTLNITDTSGRDLAAASFAVPTPADVMQFRAIDQPVNELRQRYYAEAAKKQASPVLQNFDLYQTGDRVRLVDADGSVYEGVTTPDAGSVEVLRRSEQAPSEAERKDSARPTSGPVGSTSRAKLTLRASGTNRTMNQLVVINANLVPDSSSFGREAKRPAQTTAPSATRARALDSTIAVTQSLRFEGKARIGATNEMRIDAIRISR